VLGLFLYDIPDTKPHEIDVEFAKWWDPDEPNNAQYVVHPWQNPGNMVRFKVDCNAIDITTHEIIWTPECVEFSSYFGDYPLRDPCDIIYSWSYTGPDIPQAKDERARMNFWLLPPKDSAPGTPGAPPMDGQEAEIVIKNFIKKCFTSSHPDYDDWVDAGSPCCWCYPRQCHGDANNFPYGKSNYWTSIPDLEVLKAAWNKNLATILGKKVIDFNPSCTYSCNVLLICADFDHKPYGKFNYRVSIPDLAILKANWNIPNKPDPNCFN
jgi:hypothetical protein